MNRDKIAEMLDPILSQIEKRSAVADTFVDKETYRLYLTTFWANLVMDPEEAELTETDLETAHSVINGIANEILGESEAITESFRFIASRSGETAMNKAKLSKSHKDLPTYFSSMILDPDGHRKWMSELRDR
jgi:hypothetical protein